MSTNRTPDDLNELEQVQDELDQARAAYEARSERVVDLTIRFRELRRKNHFRIMLEDLFNE